MALVAFIGIHRGHKVIKASNPRFAVLILFGAALAHVGLISSTWQNDGRNSFVLTSFLVGTGYSLMFSSLVVKTYMIYSIFTAKRVGAMKNKLKRYLSFIVFMFALQCLLSALWYTFDKNPIISVSVSGTMWTIRSFDGNWVVLCSLPVVFLTLAGVFLSFKTRHVQSAFNESHYIGITTYAIAMALLVVAPVTLLLQAPLVQYIIAAFLVTLTTLAVQGIFFGHKVMAVLSPQSDTEMVSNPQGGDTQSSENGGVSTTVRCKYCHQAIQGSQASKSSMPSSPAGAGPKLNPLGATAVQLSVQKSGKA
ncbi:7 transmembrane sweet-taste receptor of 3 GCPR-domain-containing protein [Blastocladiella britannica]|nr:7 transmembrane sweet-taste receptor of 3 GCPR-domain-containing protein [Blastocladiella britannica]